MTQRRLLTALILMVATFFFTARAQSFNAFTEAMFDDLYADTVSCGSWGLDESPFDYSRCGLIGDNLVAINKRIVDRHIEGAGMIVLIPWVRNHLGSGVYNHQVGFMNFSSNLSFVVNYLELGDSSSFVWVTGNR